MSFSKKHPDGHRLPARRLPKIAEREGREQPESSLDLTFDPRTGDLTEPARRQYQVFLKRNLKWQSPPADLLGRIQAEMNKIDKER